MRLLSDAVGDWVMSEASTERAGEVVRSKEPGMECERGVGKTSGPGVRVEELARFEEDSGLLDHLMNLPVDGSRCGLLIKGVAKGNQEPDEM